MSIALWAANSTSLRNKVNNCSAELERAKRYLVGSHEIALQRRSAVAASLAFNEAYGLGWDQYRRYASSVTQPSLALFTRRMYLARVPRVALKGGCTHAARRASIGA